MPYDQFSHMGSAVALIHFTEHLSKDTPGLLSSGCLFSCNFKKKVCGLHLKSAPRYENGKKHSTTQA